MEEEQQRYGDKVIGLGAGHRPYILFGVQGPLEEFRLPEIESVAKLFKIDYSWPVKPDYTVSERASERMSPRAFPAPRATPG